MKQRNNLDHLRRWASRHKTILLRVGGVFVAVLLVSQLLYPTDRLPLFSTVDGVALSGWKKSDATKHLDKLSAKQPVDVALGRIDKDFDTPKPGDIGISVSNDARVKDVDYPWYVRVIPTSLLWYGLVQSEEAPAYSHDEAKATEYIVKKFGQDCVIAAKDATLRQNGDTLETVPAKSGGVCRIDDATKVLLSAKPRLNDPAELTIPMDVTAPTVGDAAARRLGETLNTNSQGGVKLKVSDKMQTISQKEVLSWLTFSSKDGDVVFATDAEKANGYLSKQVTPLVAKPAGVTKVSTLDFTETSRNDGATGQTLATDVTLGDISNVLRGNKDVATAAVTQLAPKVEYTRSYTKSSTGIAAQLRFYDEDNAGVFGVSFVELGGQGLSAQHNGTRQFVTASTYKLFVAFSTLKRVDAGTYKWDDANIASGRNLSTCFDDMIVKSDNACAEALIKKIGASELNADIRSLGLSNTAFKSDNNVTTANDLANYLTQLEKGTMPIKPESRERLLGAMKRNVYRQGVPAGASGQTADKVGFLWGLLHDAAIVYSPKGTYVLTVMTDGSSWGNIADLTRKIEALR